MAEIKFTPEQQKCIDLHDRNILVSAAAGSGKTAVLVERIVKSVCDENNPKDIDRMLIVTFTNAAAAEMRERIANRINEEIEKNPTSEHLQRQATLIHNAQITTIDSFSLFLVRNHFNEIGLDPAFRVADEGEIKLLKNDVMKAMLEEKFAQALPEFEYCVEYFCPGGREEVLEEYILGLSKFAASFPWPKEWLQERKHDYDYVNARQFAESSFGKYFLNYFSATFSDLASKMQEAIDICEAPAGPYMYGELLDKEKELFEKYSKLDDLNEIFEKVPAIVFETLPRKKDDSVDSNLREQAKAIRDDVKKIVCDIKEKFLLTPLDLVISQGKECAPVLNTLIDLVIEFDDLVSRKKLEKKIIDFNDMEHFALEILLKKNENGEVSPSNVAYEYRQHFDEVMIDEYQDSNLVQEYLLKAVSGEDDNHFNRFMVGDVKQSIYKFRLARPQLFIEKYGCYSKDNSDMIRIDLSKNFRSRPEVIGSVNQIFDAIMSKETGGIEYDEAARLYQGADYPANSDCGTELLIFDKQPGDRKGDVIEAESAMIANRIHDLMKNHRVTDKATGEFRPARYSDIVILLRSLKDWDEGIKGNLEKQGIPVYVQSKTGYFEATEVQNLLQFLRVLDNPRQDIPLFGLLKSFFGGFDDEQLALIKTIDRKKTLYDILISIYQETECPGKNDSENDAAVDTEIVHKIKAFIDMINTYRECSLYMTIRTLLQRILDDTGYLDYVTALPAGNKRRANVEMLLTKASDFESTSYYGLFHFVRYIEQLEEYNVDYGEADTLDENADVVRLMSIHKSKGLEFPITIVAGMGKAFNNGDLKNGLVIDMDMGLGIDYVNPVKRIKNKTFRKNVLVKKMREDDLSEELRILYVALTRAKEKLIMTATISKAIEKLENTKSSRKKLSYTQFINSQNYMDFLLPIIDSTDVKVKVMTEENIFTEEIKQVFDFTKDISLLDSARQLSDEKALDVLKERFGFVYPYDALKNMYTKTTVSELKIAAMADKDEEAFHLFEEKEVVPFIPRFKKEDEKVSGTVRGNAFHRVMEILDFDKVIGDNLTDTPADYEEYTKLLSTKKLRTMLQSFLDDSVEKQLLTAEYREAVNETKILKFLTSKVAYRMWNAHLRGQLYREQPFVYGVDAKKVSPDFPEDEKVLIQGIIDVFFVEDEKIILLDYKTDVIKNMEDLWRRYGVQLDYYSEALTRLMDIPVKEKIIYSFYLEKENAILV